MLLVLAMTLSGIASRKGPETQAAKAHDHFPATDHSHRRNRIHHGSRRRLDVDEPVEALVGGDIGIDQALDHVGQGRIGLSQRGVHGRAALSVRSGQVERNPALLDLHLQNQPNRAIRHPVIVQQGFRFVDSVRQFRDFGTGPALGVFDQFIHESLHRLGAEPGQDLRHPFLSQQGSGNLSPKISRGLAGRADVGQDETEDVVDDLAFGDQFGRRDDDSLLVELR